MKLSIQHAYPSYKSSLLESLSPLKLNGYQDKINCSPTHLDLMNHIAVNVPTKWRDIGLQLGLRVTDLDVIEARHFSDYKRCFSAVFNLWENQLTSPYSWSTILLALTSPLVGECRLAEQTRSMLTQATLSLRYMPSSLPCSCVQFFSYQMYCSSSPRRNSSKTTTSSENFTSLSDENQVTS